MIFCIQGPIPSEIFNILFITIPECPSPISVKREVILPLTPVTSWGSPPSDLVPGWRVLPGFLSGHQAHLPHPETPRNQLSSPTPVLCRVSDPWERAEADSDRGAKRPEAHLHQGGLCCWSWPWFFLYIFNRKWRDSDMGHFFLGCSLSWRHLTADAQRTWLCLALWADSQPRPGLLAPQSWTLGKECRGANSFRICRKIG